MMDDYDLALHEFARTTAIEDLKAEIALSADPARERELIEFSARVIESIILFLHKQGVEAKSPLDVLNAFASYVLNVDEALGIAREKY